MVHSLRERNHQGIDLIDATEGPLFGGRVRRRERVGGLLNYYRAA